MIVQIVTMATKTAVDELLERRQEEVFTRHRGGITGVKWLRHNGHSPSCTYADKVKSTLNNQNTYKSKNISMVKDTREKPVILQAEKEDNQTVKSLQFCNLKKCKDENVEEWMKRVRSEAKECEYQEQERWIKEQFICSLDNEGIKAKVINEVKSKTDNITSEQVLMLAKQEEIHKMQLRGVGQTNAKEGQANAEMIRAGTCKYCGSSHPPRRCPAYGVMCGVCSWVNHFSAVCRAPRWWMARREEWSNG